MPSLFRRILSNHSTKREIAQRDEGASRSVAVEDAPTAQNQDAESPAATQNVAPRHAPVSEVARADALPAPSDGPDSPERAPEIDSHRLKLDQHGLIPAEQLPPAAEILAQMFPSEKESPSPWLGGDAAEETETASLDETASALIRQTDQATRPAEKEAVPESLPEPAPEGHSAACNGQSASADVVVDDNTEGSFNSAAAPAPAASMAGEEPALTETRRCQPPDEVEPQSMTADTDDASAAAPEAASNAELAVPVRRDPPIPDPMIAPEGAEAAARPAREMTDDEIVKAASLTALDSPASNGRDWRLEEKLASHMEWLDSRGKHGRRADLSDADLEGQELIGVQLKFADLHDANLRAADLLLADLRDASLVRADLEDACLVGANLEAANLEGASLETAMGLVPRQIAGANLRDALLPPQIMEFDAAARFARASRIAWNCFAPLIPSVLISWLIIWKAKDAQLLTDSAVIPYLHSRTAAAALPTAQIFLLAPLVIFCLYLVFQFQLQKVWEAALELPAIFPDGHPLDDRGPGLIVGLLRTHFWWVSRDRTSTQWVEKTLCVLSAYWLAPFTLTLFWARYLTMQEAKGTLLQTLLVAVSTGLALHATFRTGRPQEHWAAERKRTRRVADGLRRISPVITASVWGFVLLLLSVGTMLGVPHERARAPQYGPASIRRWGADVFWSFGFDPYADLTEATLSRKPKGWTGSNAQVALVTGPELNEAKFRYAQAYGVFLANGHLWHSNFEGAYLSDADLRGADLGHSDLRHAILDGTMLSGANLNRARLDGAVLARGDLRWANLSYASLANATLVDARLNGATLYDTQLSCASLARADLENVDLRGASLNAADLDHADLQQALLWSAKLPGANLFGARLQDAVAIGADLRSADLREARFAGTVLSDADLSGANLDRADLRGALELTAQQVCSTESRRGALLPDALATQVTAQCSGLQ